MKFDIATNIIYILFFIFIYFFLFVISEFKVNRKQTCIIIGFLLFIGLAFRSLDQGLNDTKYVYMGMYELAGEYSWRNLYESLICEYTSSVFVTILKLTYIISFGNFRFFIILMSAIFVYSYEKCIQKYCDNLLIAHLIFISFIYPYGFFLIRQCLSMSILCFAFMSFMQTQNSENKVKKYAKSIILATLSVSIHSISLLFVIAVAISYLLLKKLKVNKNIIVIMQLVLAVIIVIMPSIFFNLLNYLPAESKYSKLLGLYSTNNLWVIPLVVYLAISINLFFVYKKDNNFLNNAMLILSFASVIFIATTGIVQDMARIAYYFSLPTMYLASNNSIIQKSNILFVKKGYLSAFMVLIILAYSLVITLPNNNIIYWFK